MRDDRPRVDNAASYRHAPTLVNTTSLLLNVLFGSIGFGFFLYGKKQRVTAPLVCGLALMIFPYFVSNNLLLAAIGTALTAAPYFLRE